MLRPPLDMVSDISNSAHETPNFCDALDKA